jgi:hypothetical protein
MVSVITEQVFSVRLYSDLQLKTRSFCVLHDSVSKHYITLLLQVIKSSRVTLESSGYIPGSSSFPTDEATLDGML